MSLCVEIVFSARKILLKFCVMREKREFPKIYRFVLRCLMCFLISQTKEISKPSKTWPTPIGPTRPGNITFLESAAPPSQTEMVSRLRFIKLVFLNCSRKWVWQYNPDIFAVLNLLFLLKLICFRQKLQEAHIGPHYWSLLKCQWRVCSILLSSLQKEYYCKKQTEEEESTAPDQLEEWAKWV